MAYEDATPISEKWIDDPNDPILKNIEEDFSLTNANEYANLFEEIISAITDTESGDLPIHHVKKALTAYKKALRTMEDEAFDYALDCAIE